MGGAAPPPPTTDDRPAQAPAGRPSTLAGRQTPVPSHREAKAGAPPPGAAPTLGVREGRRCTAGGPVGMPSAPAGEGFCAQALARVEAIAASGTVAVLLPGAFYYLREKQAPPVAALRKRAASAAASLKARSRSPPCTASN